MGEDACRVQQALIIGYAHTASARERDPCTTARRPMAAALTLDHTAVRRRFSALQSGFAFLDAPGGSQVPDSVGEAIARALREASANMGALYETSRRVGAIVAEA